MSSSAASAPGGDDIITLRRYSSLPDAYVALGALRNAGITSTVTNTLSTLYIPAPAPAGGCCLQVFARDAERAEAILAEGGLD